MSSVIKSYPIFKSVCLYIAITLIALLLLGPFLHAHYGKSTVTGLHLAGVNAVAMSQEEPVFVSFSQDQEHESAAVGIGPSYARQASLDVGDPPQALLIMAVFVLAALSIRVMPSVWRQLKPRISTPAFAPGFPALAHAPPSFHL